MKQYKFIYQIYIPKFEELKQFNVISNSVIYTNLQVDQFKYLGSVIAANGGVEADVHHKSEWRM